MKTSIWGPSGWKFLHSIAFSYPDEPTKQQQQEVKNLFTALKYLLPCGDCCMNYSNEVGEIPVESNDKLSRWLVDFHNSVNKRLGKPTYNYDQIKLEYPDDSCDLSCHDEPKSYKTFIIILSIALIGLLFYFFV